MNTVSKLLEQLAYITTFRDIRRLELSLLKTLHDIFTPDALLLLQLDANQQPSLLFRYDPVASQMQEQMPMTHQPALEALIHQAIAADCPVYDLPSDHQQTWIYPVLDLKEMNLCLILQGQGQLSANDNRLISSFLEVYRNFCLLIEDVQTDQLTGLLNRKTFEENFQHLTDELHQDVPEHLADDQRASLPQGMESYWMAVIDLDNFKRINDTFGHIYGDEVLILLARLMKVCFRTQDLLYRFGGEEFVVITRCQDLQGAHTSFERLRRAVENYDFPQIGRVTISIGVVQLQSGLLATSLFDQADKALYHAKKHGKNQVRFYQELVQGGQIKPVQPKAGSIELF